MKEFSRLWLQLDGDCDTFPETQRFQYAGEERDENGLIFLRARYYNPSIGRFMSRDPLPKSGPGITGWNRYAYAGDNPAAGRDPSGLRTYYVTGIESPGDQYDLDFAPSLTGRGIMDVCGPFFSFTAQGPLAGMVNSASNSQWWTSCSVRYKCSATEVHGSVRSMGKRII